MSSGKKHQDGCKTTSPKTPRALLFFLSLAQERFRPNDHEWQGEFGNPRSSARPNQQIDDFFTAASKQ
ncbi:hypothetical protein [Rhizobium sp. RAF56]|uniref:hypothetical protein n=1 Tax=Rhizobium sp. RAF56 TaxID=3233062 RepID=UPI003F9A19F5